MGRVIKLAQRGYDALTAGDENLIYSSEWPLLPIYLQGSFTIPDVTQQTVIAEHDLNYYPAFWFFSNSKITGYENAGIQTSEARSEFFGPMAGGTIQVDQNKLIYVPTSGTSGSLSLYYYIFLTDLQKAFTAPISSIGSVQAGATPGRVFKLAKAGKDINSDRIEDYIIHSDARSPMIHSVNFDKVGNDYSVYHTLGYNPMFFCYNFNGTRYTLLPTGSSNNYVLGSDGQRIHFTQSSTAINQLSTLILKDPFLASYSRTATV